MKCQKWKAKAEELQQVAEKKRYESPLQLAERSIQTTVKVYNTAYFLDGETAIHEKPEILDGFANHFDHLLNISREVDRTDLDTIAHWPNISFLD